MEAKKLSIAPNLLAIQIKNSMWAILLPTVLSLGRHLMAGITCQVSRGCQIILLCFKCMFRLPRTTLCWRCCTAITNLLRYQAHLKLDVTTTQMTLLTPPRLLSGSFKVAFVQALRKFKISATVGALSTPTTTSSGLTVIQQKIAITGYWGKCRNITLAQAFLAQRLVLRRCRR